MTTRASKFPYATAEGRQKETEGSAVSKQQDHTLSSLLASDSFLALDPEIQKQIIAAVKSEQEISGGLFGKLLGTRRDNLAVHAVLLICLTLLLLIILDNLYAYCAGTALNMELVNIVVPVITLAIGYMIGNGGKYTHN